MKILPALLEHRNICHKTIWMNITHVCKYVFNAENWCKLVSKKLYLMPLEIFANMAIILSNFLLKIGHSISDKLHEPDNHVWHSLSVCQMPTNNRWCRRPAYWGEFLYSDGINSSQIIPDNQCLCTLIARFMGPTWGPSGADRTQVGPILAPWTLLSGYICLYVCAFYTDAHIEKLI